MENYLTAYLSNKIGTERLSAVLESTSAIERFPLDIQAVVIRAFGQGYSLQMKVLSGFVGAQFLTVGMLWRRKQISVVREKHTE